MSLYVLFYVNVANFRVIIAENVVIGIVVLYNACLGEYVVC
jgi:hypothetical protein